MDTRRAMATSCRPSQRAAEGALPVATEMGVWGEKVKSTCRYLRASGQVEGTFCAVSCDAVGSTTHEQLADGAPGIAAGAGAQPAETSIG